MTVYYNLQNEIRVLKYPYNIAHAIVIGHTFMRWIRKTGLAIIQVSASI